MLVVDANVVAYLLIEGDKTAQARDLWMMDRDWHAPGLLFYELGNVFAQLVKQGAIPLEAGMAGLESAVGLVRLHEQDLPATRFLEIAAKLVISAYDASYLATAEALGARLITEDRGLLRVAPEVTRSLGSFSAGA
jgi:predicted nucleic acid-binding protein